MNIGLSVDGCAGPVALAVAHPGHELRLATWIERVKPAISIFTAGSRHGASRARVDGSRRLAELLGATEGAVFGAHLDRDVYRWIMAGDAPRFVRLAEDLADGFIQQRVRTVVTDAWQLYNVAHDLWHLTVRSAVSRASAQLGWTIDCLDYEVVPRGMAGRDVGPLRFGRELTPSEVEHKLKLAARFPEIADDLREVIEAGGMAFLASETLHELRPLAELIPARGERPIYEAVGEDRVAGGIYGSVLRWGNVEPIALALEPGLPGTADAA